MMQCMGKCHRFIDPPRGEQLKIGLLRTVVDRFGNKIIAEIKCQECAEEQECTHS